MLFPIALIPVRDKNTIEAIAPDIPDSRVTADTLDNAMYLVKDAISMYLERLENEDIDIPYPDSIQNHSNKPEFANCIWALAEVDLLKCMGKSIKINVTLPAFLIPKIDRYVAKNSACSSRSAFLAESAIMALDKK